MKRIAFVLCFVVTCLWGVAQEADIKALCFNVRYDNPSDGEFVWKNRRSAVVKMIKELKPSVMGFQEVLDNQLEYLKKELSGYSYIGVGREDGKTKGEYAPIFYDKGALTLIQSGHFWLSPTFDKPSKGWDAACERIATWALLECKQSKKRFVCINTHFDHVGEKARLESGKMLLNNINALSDQIPAIIMGDFNTTVDDVSLSPITSKFANVRDAQAVFGDQVAYTYIGFGADQSERALIDHIFVNHFRVADYRVVVENFGVKQLSDHLPVVCELNF